MLNCVSLRFLLLNFRGIFIPVLFREEKHRAMFGASVQRNYDHVGLCAGYVNFAAFHTIIIGK